MLFRSPPIVLRLLGPILVTLTMIVFASGIALLLTPTSWHARMLFVHKASFILWIIGMTVHVLGHLLDTARLAPRDWLRRTRREVTGAGTRQWLIATSLVVGVLLSSSQSCEPLAVRCAWCRSLADGPQQPGGRRG